jgi:hypothetical protein
VISWLFILPFDSPLSLCHLQDLTESELAEIPSCDLAKMVHNKRLQQSGNRGTDLYVVTVDDFVRAVIQVVRYYQYLNGERTSTSPGKEELLLSAAKCSTEQTRGSQSS